MSSITDAVKHPVSLATAAAGLLGGVLNVPLVAELWSWLVFQSGTLFTAGSLFAFTVAPEVEGIPAEQLKPVVLVLGVIYGGSKVWAALKNLQERLS